MIMVKLGIIQTGPFRRNTEGISKVSNLLKDMGRKNTDIVCLPEQWLKNNNIPDFSKEFSEFFQIADRYSMTIIPGAFYQKVGKKQVISSPVIGPTGSIIGNQEKIHPFDYERKLIEPGKIVKVFNTACKFSIIICYDMVFPNVVNTAAKKGADVIFSPSRIVKRGIESWHMYCQVRALENRIPILAANVQNNRFGGKSIIIDLIEKDKIVLPKVTTLRGQSTTAKKFNLIKYKKNRKKRFSDAQKFR